MVKIAPYERAFVSKLENRLKEKKLKIQLLLGPRQVGKTTGVLQLLKRLKKESAYYVSADDVYGSGDAWLESQLVTAKLNTKEQGIFIVDEIQNLTDWAQAIKKIWDREQREKSKMKFVLLGSASIDLITGANESLAGRYEVLSVKHWSFEESRKVLKLSFDEYLSIGGYPDLALFKRDLARCKSFLEDSIINAVIGKDIQNLKNIRKPALFKQCFYLAAQYPAHIISYSELLGQLHDKGNTDLVKQYLELYASALMIVPLENYYKMEVRRRKSSPKLIFCAPALYGCSRSKGKEGFYFEAWVGSELLISGVDRLYYFRNHKKEEVDYVFELNQQVYALEVKSRKTKSHRGWEAFKKEHPKSKGVILEKSQAEVFAKDPIEFIKKYSV